MEYRSPITTYSTDIPPTPKIKRILKNNEKNLTDIIKTVLNNASSNEIQNDITHFIDNSIQNIKCIQKKENDDIKQVNDILQKFKEEVELTKINLTDEDEFVFILSNFNAYVNPLRPYQKIILLLIIKYFIETLHDENIKKSLNDIMDLNIERICKNINNDKIPFGENTTQINTMVFPPEIISSLLPYVSDTEDVPNKTSSKELPPVVHTYFNYITTSHRELENHISDNKPKIQKELNSKGVTSLSYSELCKNSFENIGKRLEFVKLAYKYSTIHDYIDMVHDLTKCRSDIIEVFKGKQTIIGVHFYNQTFDLDVKTISEIVKELTDIKGLLCSTQHNIIISQSHVLQEKYMIKFIQELNNLGITIPALSDDTLIEKNNLQEYINKNSKGIINIARESGPYLDKYVDDVTKKRMNLIKLNNLGAIDGCRGECILSDKPIEWKHNIVGCCNITITAYRSKTIIKVSLFDNITKYITFQIIGEIVLDDVTQLIETYGIFSEVKYRGTIPRKSNNITIIDINQLKNLTKHEIGIMCMSLKTLCDQRLLQLMETDYSSSENQIWGITTTDSYVSRVNLFKTMVKFALNTNIKADFPKIFLNSGDNFRVTSYSLNPDDSYFCRMFYILTNETFVKDFLNKTSEFIELSFIDSYDQSNIETIPDQICHFLYTRSISQYKQIWKDKKETYMKNYKTAIDDYTSQSQTRNLSTILLSLTDPPNFVPIMDEIYSYIYDSTDICDSLFVEYSNNTHIDWRKNCEIDKLSNSIIISDEQTINKLLENKYINEELDDIFVYKNDNGIIKRSIEVPITIEIMIKLLYKYYNPDIISLKLSNLQDRTTRTKIVYTQTAIEEYCLAQLPIHVNLLLFNGADALNKERMAKIKDIIKFLLTSKNQPNISKAFSSYTYLKPSDITTTGLIQKRKTTDGLPNHKTKKIKATSNINTTREKKRQRNILEKELFGSVQQTKKKRLKLSQKSILTTKSTNVLSRKRKRSILNNQSARRGKFL